MNTSDVITFASRLATEGASIYVSVEAADGARSFELKPADTESFLKSPEAWKAKQWGITPAQLDEWHLNDRMPRCGGMTKSKRRCRNALASETDPNEFAKLHGGRCTVHS